MLINISRLKHGWRKDEILLDNYPRSPKLKNIANGVYNILLSKIAIMLNIATIHAIRKTPSLPKTLLLSLAVSDAVVVGLVSDPFYVALLIKWLHKNSPGCDTYKAFYFIASLFSSASFFGVVAVSVDRFLAIHLHLRYQELVTHKQCFCGDLNLGVLNVFTSLAMFRVPRDIYSFIFIGVLLTMMIVRLLESLPAWDILFRLTPYLAFISRWWFRI